ncbi:c-Myc-binding protein homolog [Hippocampus zosterae]|uniref:c-Myc-binding protein homolog n=1 Tax=Hippocampus zosterae TaxID=109293 RepID=UPI00223DE9CC|nr:c-Myc-binding protein homolog [Hippocampus zosterae]
MSYQTTDSKKEEFRKYLEKAGVIDQLTRVLVGLYEEPSKPNNAIDYVKKYLGSPTDIDVEKLKLEYEKVKEENSRLKKQVEDLKRKSRSSKARTPD